MYICKVDFENSVTWKSRFQGWKTDLWALFNSLEAALVYTLAKIEVGKTFKRTFFLSYFDHTCQTPFLPWPWLKVQNYLRTWATNWNAL